MSGETTTAAPYIVTRDVQTTECPWLETDVPKGTRVYRYGGVTYGCIGPDGIAVTAEPGALPFFELPRGAVSPTPPHGEER